MRMRGDVPDVLEVLKQGLERHPPLDPGVLEDDPQALVKAAALQE